MKLIFALAIAMHVGADPKNELAMWSKTTIMPPQFASSLKCQEAAAQLNKRAGSRIRMTVGDVTVDGPFYGTWCVVPIKHQEKL